MTDIRSILYNHYLDREKYLLDAGSSGCTGFGDGNAESGGAISYNKINAFGLGSGSGYARGSSDLTDNPYGGGAGHAQGYWDCTGYAPRNSFSLETKPGQGAGFGWGLGSGTPLCEGEGTRYER